MESRHSSDLQFFSSLLPASTASVAAVPSVPSVAMVSKADHHPSRK